MNSGKVVVFGQKWFYSGKSGCTWAKVVEFGQKWLYSCKSCCNRAKMDLFGQKWLYSGIVVVFGQKVVVFG